MNRQVAQIYTDKYTNENAEENSSTQIPVTSVTGLNMTA